LEEATTTRIRIRTERQSIEDGEILHHQITNDSSSSSSYGANATTTATKVGKKKKKE